jgi:hypothetical protein
MPQEKAIYQLATRTIIRTLSGSAILMGALMAWGGPRRFSAPAFETARAVPGGVYTWAVAATASGVISWAGIWRGWRRPIVGVGLACQGGWYAFLDVSLWLTATADPTVPLAGPVVYALVAVICLILYSAGHELHALEGTV